MILKSHDHGSESQNKFKNSLLKITQRTWQINFGHFFRVCHFCKKPFFVVAGGAFVMCQCYRYRYFQMELRGAISAGCHFCWMHLMVLFLFSLHLTMCKKSIS